MRLLFIQIQIPLKQSPDIRSEVSIARSIPFIIERTKRSFILGEISDGETMDGGMWRNA